MVFNDDITSHWKVIDYCKAWRIEHKGRVALGTTLHLPGQYFTVVQKLFWRFTNRKKPKVSLVWESRCMICGASYRFNLPRRGFTSMVRTCEAHRGKFRASRSRLKPAPKRLGPKPSLQPALGAALEALSLTYSQLDRSALLDLLAPLATPSAGRDTRRQRVAAALQAMHDNGSLPICASLTETGIIFV